MQEDANTPRICDHMKAKPDGNKPIDILATTPGGKKVEFEESNSQILRILRAGSKGILYYYLGVKSHPVFMDLPWALHLNMNQLYVCQ